MDTTGLVYVGPGAGEPTQPGFIGAVSQLGPPSASLAGIPHQPADRRTGTLVPIQHQKHQQNANYVYGLGDVPPAARVPYGKPSSNNQAVKPPAARVPYGNYRNKQQTLATPSFVAVGA